MNRFYKYMCLVFESTCMMYNTSAVFTHGSMHVAWGVDPLTFSSNMFHKFTYIMFNLEGALPPPRFGHAWKKYFYRKINKKNEDLCTVHPPTSSHNGLGFWRFTKRFWVCPEAPPSFKTDATCTWYEWISVKFFLFQYR